MMWKVFFTNWEYSVVDGLVRYECDSEEKAWAWVDAHEWELGAEENFEVERVD